MKKTRLRHDREFKISKVAELELVKSFAWMAGGNGIYYDFPI